MQAERITSIELHSSVIAYRSPEVEYEYRTAVDDLLRKNRFSLRQRPGGPYSVELGIQENRLMLRVRPEQAPESQEFTRIALPMTPFRRLIRDYFMICDSYYRAIRSPNPSQVETVDMAKRALHNEGAESLQEVLSPQIDVDFDTARRLFTLVCVLHVK